jgi:hypothetical protein
MEDAVRAHEAAREALADVEPERLREALYDRLAAASMTPAVLALVGARAVDPAVDADGIAERAAGVQLIYEGLRQARTLAHEEPWREADGEADIAADLDVLAANVLVARGFYLLARTEAAERAVEVVRAFGRDQTERREATDPTRLDRNLEADVFALAAVAGTTAVGGDPRPELVEFAADLAREYDGELPPPNRVLPDPTVERLAALSRGDDPVPSSATDP